MTATILPPLTAAPLKPREPKDWLSRKEAARYLTEIGCPIAPKTLANLASNDNAGKGPAYTLIGWGLVRYQIEDLRAWARQRMRRIV